ncbi:putative head morphogenesis protein [Vibrio phage 137E35-1]|nr:putative head morphogenesis protein [Vibrio phage 137E35-1]CAH9015392.1 putative head morphogenesis protein [Vibrio phage 230E39-1]
MLNNYSQITNKGCIMADYIQELNRREVAITRFATYLLNNYAYPSLQEALKSARLILLDAESITSRTKLGKVEREIIKTIKKPFADVLAEIEKEMGDFAISEGAFSATALEDATGIPVKAPSADAVLALATKEYMTLETKSAAVSAPFANFAAGNVDNTMSMIIGQISAGFSKSETVPQMIARLKQVINGVLKNHIETLVRTGVAFYAQQSRNAMRDENLDIIKREVPIVTFDNRTSFTCMSISDKYPEGWKVGQSPIGYPPYHYGCRTIIGYWTSDDVDFEGTRASVGGSHSKEAEEAAEDGKLSFRKRKDKDYFDPTPIPAKTKFTKWLKTQPRWYIQQQLGKELGDRFIKGDITLASLTDKNLKPLTLAQINARG